jgi:hypothetical protein
MSGKIWHGFWKVTGTLISPFVLFPLLSKRKRLEFIDALTSETFAEQLLAFDFTMFKCTILYFQNPLFFPWMVGL